MDKTEALKRLDALETENAALRKSLAEKAAELDATRSALRKTIRTYCVDDQSWNPDGRADALMEQAIKREAAEKALTEAYQRGYATGREEIEKERDNANAAAVGIALQMEKLQAEHDALRAKITEQEKK